MQMQLSVPSADNSFMKMAKAHQGTDAMCVIGTAAAQPDVQLLCADIVQDSISRSDVDVRRELYNSILLTGLAPVLITVNWSIEMQSMCTWSILHTWMVVDGILIHCHCSRAHMLLPQQLGEDESQVCLPVKPVCEGRLHSKESLGSVLHTLAQEKGICSLSTLQPMDSLSKVPVQRLANCYITLFRLLVD